MTPFIVLVLLALIAGNPRTLTAHRLLRQHDVVTRHHNHVVVWAHDHASRSSTPRLPRRAPGLLM